VTKEPGSILGPFRVDVSHVRIGKEEMVPDFQWMQTPDALQHAPFFQTRTRKVFCVKGPVNAFKAVVKSKLFEEPYIGQEIAQSQLGETNQ